MQQCTSAQFQSKQERDGQAMLLQVVSKEEAEAMQAQAELLVSEQACGHLYGITKASVQAVQFQDKVHITPTHATALHPSLPEQVTLLQADLDVPCAKSVCLACMHALACSLLCLGTNWSASNLAPCSWFGTAEDQQKGGGLDNHLPANKADHRCQTQQERSDAQ